MDYDAVLAELATWAEETDHVRALLLTGSAAAGDRLRAETDHILGMRG